MTYTKQVKYNRSASSYSSSSYYYHCEESPEIRIRREWSALGDYGKALYIDAIETAIERKLHQRFVEWHAHHLVHLNAHDTCSFFLWHRRFTLAYENMLRSLEPRFACLSIPFWDISRDYRKQEDGTFQCREYGTCSDIIRDLGGWPPRQD